MEFLQVSNKREWTYEEKKLNASFINASQNLEMLETKKYLRMKIWNQKPDSFLKLRDGNIYDFQKMSKKEEIVEKLNKLIQLSKDKGMSSNLESSLATSSTNSIEEKSTPIISFERTIWVVEQSSEDSWSNEGTSSKREYEEEAPYQRINLQ